MDDARFDEEYYQRYYMSAQTRVTERARVEMLAALVCSFVSYHEIPVRRVLDIGCGMGYWRPVIEERFENARWTGVETSQYLCDRFGWLHASMTDYKPRGRFDIVVCQDVLQYLNETDARMAIDNLASWCRGVLYFDALTQEDWDNNVDQKLTDGDVYLRTAAWYRKYLRRHFIFVGAGLHVHRSSDVVLFELEKAKE